MKFKKPKSQYYNVIIAEDNPEHQKLIKKLIEQYNVNIDIVNNGQELLDKLNYGRTYDIVIMDIQMPVMDGYTATEAIRKNPEFSNLIIIGLTAFAMQGDEQIALSKGMNDYITKPITKQTLHRALSRHLVLKKS
ncbi:MAG: response regulator [Candidatus Latescibacteria bacterium]|nr:response regulator [Candidatus Latescibacterota bacterium]